MMGMKEKELSPRTELEQRAGKRALLLNHLIQSKQYEEAEKVRLFGLPVATTVTYDAVSDRHTVTLKVTAKDGSLVTFEEALHDFPSDQLLAQIGLLS